MKLVLDLVLFFRLILMLVLIAMFVLVLIFGSDVGLNYDFDCDVGVFLVCMGS